MHAHSTITNAKFTGWTETSWLRRFHYLSNVNYLCTFRYDAGDHVAIYPANDSALVEQIGRLLNINLDDLFSLVNLDGMV